MNFYEFYLPSLYTFHKNGDFSAFFASTLSPPRFALFETPGAVLMVIFGICALFLTNFNLVIFC